MKTFTAAIIGLGQIGQGYDYDLSAKYFIKTHATGFHYHPGFELIAGVDPDGAQRERFERKFNCPAFNTPQELFTQMNPEVVSIAVPTRAHLEVFGEVMKSKPHAVVCEKPLGESLTAAKEMASLAIKQNCTLMVNYGRRFDPSVQTLKNAIAQGDFGQIYKGVVWYSKGLRNNGSHFVDLLGFLLGEAGRIKLVEAGRCYGGDDPEPDFTIQFGAALISFLSAREECFTHCEMELIGTGGCIKYLQSGAVIDMRRAVAHPHYSGYRSLEADGLIHTDCMQQVQLHGFSQLYDHLVTGSPLNSDGQTALATLRILEKIIDQLGEPGEGLSINHKIYTGDGHE